MSKPRPVRAPRGTKLTCKSWLTEAPFRMIQNNLDPEVAERRMIWLSMAGGDRRPGPGKPLMQSSRHSKKWKRTKPCWCNPANRWLF